MKTLIITISIIASSFLSAFADPGSELLEKVKTKYAKCPFFYCEGSSSCVSKADAYKSEMKFNIWFRRPSLLRVDWMVPSGSSFSPTVCSLYVEGGKYHGIPGYTRTPEEFSSLEMGMGTYAGISAGTTFFIPSLLLGKRGYFYDYTCELLSDEKANDHECHTLKIVDKKSGTWLLSVDKDTYAIERSKQTQIVTAQESNKNREEFLKTQKGEANPSNWKPQTGDFNFTTVINYSSISFDKEIKVNEFVFRELAK